MKRVIFILIFIGVVLGPYVFVLHPKLQLLRIAVPVGLLIMLTQKIKMNELFKLLLLGLTSIFLYTLFITLFRFGEASINDIFNYVVKYLLTIYLLLAFYSEPDKYLKLLYQLSFWFIVICSGLALYEYITEDHLSKSSINDFDPEKFSYIQHIPTAFYVNSNDFAAVISLFSFFFLGYERFILKKQISKASVFVLISWGILSYVTLSRLNLLIWAVYTSFMFIKFSTVYKYRFHLASVAGLVILPAFYFLFAEKIANLLNGSDLVRLNLYLYSFVSIIESYGLGYGVNMSSVYFEQLNRPDLFEHHINTHSFHFDLIVNSGLVGFLIYVLINLVIYKKLQQKVGNNNIILAFILYHLVLFSSSSSLFLWPHYLIWFSFIGIINSKYKIQDTWRVLKI